MTGGGPNPPVADGAAWRPWLDRFRRAHGRAPRILHIGNIANNAWNNAKVLVEAGFDCDVICYDYYHIMGCPEWEDADFRGVIADQFSPDWSGVDLRGFSRPRWFAQGPRRFCVNYLQARGKGALVRSRLWWFVLELCPTRSRRRAIRAGALVVRQAAAAWRRAAWWLFVCRARFGRVVLGRRGRDPSPRPPPMTPFDERVAELIVAYGRRFPDRPDRLIAADFEPYRSIEPSMTRLLERYDLVEAYATDTIWPMLAGVPYVAYEHGTIRDIPFKADWVGRLTALGYALADFTIITNPDCRAAADRLGIARRRFVPHLIDRKYGDPAIQRGPMPVVVPEPYIFCPARHDWEIKGTGILLRAFARVARVRRDVCLLMSAWGSDLARSQAFIDEAGLAGRIVIGGPFHIHDLIRVSARAAAIVDQFRYGVFGGIGPTALAVGTPLITHLDWSKYGWCVDSEPPYYEARDEASCARAIEAAIDEDRRAQRQQRLDWMRRNYWHGQVVDGHGSIYMTVLDGSPADGLREPFPPRKRLPEPLTGAAAT